MRPDDRTIASRSFHIVLAEVSTQAPLVYRNNGSGQFRALPPDPFLVPDFYGDLTVFVDVNGDGAIDLVNSIFNYGPDETRDTDGRGSVIVKEIVVDASSQQARVAGASFLPDTDARWRESKPDLGVPGLG